MVRIDLTEINEALREVEGFTAKLALLITRSLGTVACAYVFALIAHGQLAAAINFATVIIIVAWIAQTFLQLALLSTIMVGQSMDPLHRDARPAKQFADTETILDRLDVHTAGGIKDVLDAMQRSGACSSRAGRATTFTRLRSCAPASWRSTAARAVPTHSQSASGDSSHVASAAASGVMRQRRWLL